MPLNHSQLYSKAINRAPEESQEEKDFKLQQFKVDEKLRIDWLRNDVTQKHIEQLEDDFVSGLNTAMNLAAIGNDQAAARTLIQLKTIKTVLDYAKGLRKSTNE